MSGGRMRLGMVVVRLGLLIALLAGCSGSGESNGSKDTTTTAGKGAEASPIDDPRSDVERAADQAAAEGIVLALGDFEPGWESSPAEEDDANDKELIADLADCLGVDPDLMDPDDPTADSPDFASANDEQVSASVSYMPSVEAAERVVDEIYRNADMPSCFAQTVKAAITFELAHPAEGDEPPDDLVVGEPTFNPLSFAKLGDDTVAYRTTIPLSTSGIDVDIYMDVVAVRVGRVGIEGIFQSTFSPFSTDEAERLVGVMVDRVPADAD